MKWGCCGNQSFIHPIEHRKGKWWVGLASLDWSRFICLKVEFPNQLLNQNLQPDCAMIPAGSWHLPNPFLCWLTWSHELTSKATSCKMESLAYFFSVVSFRCNTWKTKDIKDWSCLPAGVNLFVEHLTEAWGLLPVSKPWIVTTEQFRGVQKFI